PLSRTLASRSLEKPYAVLLHARRLRRLLSDAHPCTGRDGAGARLLLQAAWMGADPQCHRPAGTISRQAGGAGPSQLLLLLRTGHVGDARGAAFLSWRGCGGRRHLLVAAPHSYGLLCALLHPDSACSRAEHQWRGRERLRRALSLPAIGWR